MTASYRLVQWNRHKRIYDACLALGIVLYLSAFVVASHLTHVGDRAPSMPVVLLRALGTCALVMLHVVLAIGPIARLTPRASPLLYNRRHFGVATFLVGLAHAALSILYYHAFGNRNPFVSLVESNLNFTTLSGFPFELLGVGALAILFVMAATSHDFWLHNLTPRAWKWIHMLVYAAYVLLVGHVALGALQSERPAAFPILLGLGASALATLHLVAGVREARRDRPASPEPPGEAWIDAGPVDEIPDSRARVICLRDPALDRVERVAVFRYEGKVSAVANVCVHQQGPLGEGKIVSGCITCPWHGYQYLPHNGQSPPPFTEKIRTYSVRIDGGRVKVNPRANPPGTPVEPALISRLGIQPPASPPPGGHA